MIKEFFAITRTSIYHVRAGGEYRASAVKIALGGKSSVPLGQEICEGGMIAICKNLQGYIPERYGRMHPMTAFERRLERVNTQWWGFCTSSLVALFEKKEEAEECFKADNLQPLDPRWIEQTRNVIEEIGDDHPSFYVCHYEDMELLPDGKIT